MFYGEYFHSLDEKNRVGLPSKIRDLLRAEQIDSIVVTRGLEHCLFAYTPEEWRKLVDKLSSLPVTKSGARKLTRMFFSGASVTRPDRQGRFIVPQNLKKYAGINKEVVFIGVHDRLEIWSKEAWEEFSSTTEETLEEFAEDIW
ncbi:division/cell wall cluster transcriptional repressor MraZ [Candidatus Hydrogenedentota bacterium]